MADAFVIGFIGNKTSNYDEGRKGLDTLEIVAREARRSIPNLHVCFGLGWMKKCEFQRQGISANYTGFIPQSWLPAFYSSIDVHLVTSRIEGGPVTVLEAMACETPVVTTRVGLVPHTIVDGKNGFSADVGDINSLVRQLGELARSNEFCRHLGASARASVYPHLLGTKPWRAGTTSRPHESAVHSRRRVRLDVGQPKDRLAAGGRSPHHGRTSVGIHELVAGAPVSGGGRAHGRSLLGRLWRG